MGRSHQASRRWRLFGGLRARTRDVLRSYRRCLAQRHVILAAHLHLRDGCPSVAAAQAILMEGYNSVHFQRDWEEDEKSCHLWGKGMREVADMDWQAAKVCGGCAGGGGGTTGDGTFSGVVPLQMDGGGERRQALGGRLHGAAVADGGPRVAQQPLGAPAASNALRTCDPRGTRPLV